jgi:hypothetical protein
MPNPLFLGPSDRQRALRAALQADDPAWAPLARRLRTDTPALLREGPWSVRDKTVLPPSGDPHDFLGFAVYWWPNPATPDGLPYVSRDGEVNPEHERYDGWRIRRLFAVVPPLAEAAWCLGDAAAGAHAARLVRTWFLDPATRMNPHLRYSCHIPGVWAGSGWGVIDGHGLTDLLPALALLADAGHWTASDQGALDGWLTPYLDWLLTSEEGRFEADRPNNHGTAYDHQVVVLARHLGRDDVARRVLGEVPYRRIGLQLEHNGRQPWENARTQSWGYSTLNLHLLMELADLAAPLGLDLWHYATGDGRGIRRTLDYMLPYALGRTRWPWELINGWTGAGERWIAMLRQTARAWGEPAWAEYVAQLDGFTPESLAASRQNLHHPPD